MDSTGLLVPGNSSHSSAFMELRALLNFYKTAGLVHQSVHGCTLLHLTVSTSPEETLHKGGGKLSDNFVNNLDPDRTLKANFTLSLEGLSRINLATDMKT